jgi:phenylacetate-coenzyme A ligase PaaK-like adenylate-forming protein
LSHGIRQLLGAARARRREQWLSPEELKELRGAHLKRLDGAAGSTPYFGRIFHEAGVDPGSLDERHLTRLPILEKATLHAAEEHELLAEPADKLFPVTTSGSTGRPLRVYRSAHHQAEVSALWAHVLHAFGHGFFDSQVNIGTAAW